jgi:ABC-type sugar transport system ATPase subunit
MVQVSNLSKSYGATHALTGVAFTANPGRVTAIIGENGSGKSTLMKLIAGEETPDSGLIAFGKDEDQRSVTLVHQELALCPHLTVAENMFLGVKSSWRFSPRTL